MATKQIAIVVDNSGSMFQGVTATSQFTKIYEVWSAVKYMISLLQGTGNGANPLNAPGEEWAVSLHRFASRFDLQFSPQVLVTSANPGALNNMRNTVNGVLAQIAAGTYQTNAQNAPVAGGAMGQMTDLYGAFDQTASFISSTNAGVGSPSTRTLVLLSDGIQTIQHGGGTSLASYEAANGVISLGGIRVEAWGVGSNQLAAVLNALVAKGGTGSQSKVLSNVTNVVGGPQAAFDSAVLGCAESVISSNGILPLAPVGEPPSGLLWEQFSLPEVSTGKRGDDVVHDDSITHTHFAGRLRNFKDFEVEVDGITKDLILGLAPHAPGKPSVIATSPSGNVFSEGAPGTHVVRAEHLSSLHVPGPEVGTWQVRVLGDPQGAPMVIDLLARGAAKEFDLVVKSDPFQLAKPGETTILATPLYDGKAADGKLEARANVLGGGSFALARKRDGSYAGKVKIPHPGINPVQVTVKGKLKNGKRVERIEFASVLVGRATDPRFRIDPAVYETGRSYTVNVELKDGAIDHTTSIGFGAGISVKRFRRLNRSTAVALIAVDHDAPVGYRTPVMWHPDAESAVEAQVVDSHDDGRSKSGRIRCLEFDACGRVVGFILDPDVHVKVGCDEARLQKILEIARDSQRKVKIRLKPNGEIDSIFVC